MSATLRRSGLAALLLVAAGLVANATAATKSSEIRDEAGFFSRETVQSAESRLSMLTQRNNVRTVIHTLPSVPQEDLEKVRGMTSADRQRYFSDWTRQKSMLADSPDVYVLITKEPGHLQVRTNPALRRRGYSDADGRELRSLLLDGFKNKQYDAALMSGVSTLERQARTMRSGDHSPATVPANEGTDRDSGAAGSGSGWGGMSGLTMALLVGGGILVLLFLFSMFRSAATPNYGPGGPGGGYGAGPGYGGGWGGGGMFGNILGGLGGAMAGHWLYDNFFGSSNSAHASDNTHQNDQAGYSDNNYEAGNYGGDFDNGGDFGGDFGGGDFGGGDGGGDF